ncbi:MAG: radical SAM protein, partial [Candidatus Dadabacteria bacterium]
MRCCLIIPAWSPEDIFPSRTAGSQINYWQPLGTLYVAAALRQAGHEVSFLNGAFLAHEEILLRVEESRPDCVGIYSTAFGWSQAVRTARDLRQLLPDTFIVTGGPYPIAAPEQCLADAPWIDAAVTGEGEVTMVKMLDAIAESNGLHLVPGIAFRRGDEVCLNSPCPLITDLDRLPFPARDLLGEAERYAPPPATYRRSPVAVMITSRGCNRRCIFCFQIDRKRENGVRYRSINGVLEEIELCLRQGYREIKFIDDTIAADYDRALALAEGIRARRLDFTWFASACVNQVDRRLLRAFRKAGCWAILFGAESGVQKNLNAIRKGTTLEQIRQAVSDAKDAGLRVFTPFLFGIPGETWEEALETIEFACRLNPDVENFHALTPFPGTDLFDHAEQYGSRLPDLSAYT